MEDAKTKVKTPVTPEMIAAGWACLRRAHLPRLGPGNGLVEAYRAMAAAAPQPAASDVPHDVVRALEWAPKNGTIVRLLVRPINSEEVEWTPFDDSTEPYWTIGFNNLADTEEDLWQFAGWDWCHDCFRDGAGEILGWAPFATPPASNVAQSLESTIREWADGPCDSIEELVASVAALATPALSR